MYEYTYDIESGGILLDDRPTGMSKEPRPVYAGELDLLGVDEFYRYDKQNDVPYMWAEAHRYYYKGINIFNTKGGTLYEKPEIVLVMNKETDTPVLAEGTELSSVDIELMNRKNHDLMEVVEQITVKKIWNVYKKYKNKIDRYHVALSGGKDSIVLFELVRRTLPKSAYTVIFGDTKMEFPDTYDVIDKIEAQCKDEGIEFYRASSHFEPDESWRLFGPPSRVLRWCCTVHKSTPQTLKLREITGKDDYVGLDFVGVRKHESAMRSKYEEENYGKKQKGQYSHNPILEWTSAEVWLYIFAHDLIINAAYKKGNSRAGCLFCPMATGKSHCIQHECYPKEVERFTNIVKETIDDNNIRSYLESGGFNSRRSGRDLVDNDLKYYEKVENGKVFLTAITKYTVWNEWKKTVPNLSQILDEIIEQDKVTIVVSEDLNRLGKYKILKQALKKSAYCVDCRTCEVNCWSGALKFDENGIHIDNCIQCGSCHDLLNGCLVAESRKKPMKEQKSKSVNCFDSHAPKGEWIQDFFDKKDEFLALNTLGPNQIKAFKRFLNDAGLADTRQKTITSLTAALSQFSYDSEIVTAFILVELAHNNPQFNWYVMSMTIGHTYTRAELTEMLSEYGATKNDVTFVIGALNRIANESPFGSTLNFMSAEMKGRSVVSAKRNKCNLTDPRVLLYALYRYAEENDGYYSFSMTTLLDMTVNSVGISPVRIFGITRDELEPMLRGLSAQYQDYINVAIHLDLDNIVLSDYHTSGDVLKLLEV